MRPRGARDPWLCNQSCPCLPVRVSAGPSAPSPTRPYFITRSLLPRPLEFVLAPFKPCLPTAAGVNIFKGESDPSPLHSVSLPSTSPCPALLCPINIPEALRVSWPCPSCHLLSPRLVPQTLPCPQDRASVSFPCFLVSASPAYIKFSL